MQQTARSWWMLSFSVPWLGCLFRGLRNGRNWYGEYLTQPWKSRILSCRIWLSLCDCDIHWSSQACIQDFGTLRSIFHYCAFHCGLTWFKVQVQKNIDPSCYTAYLTTFFPTHTTLQAQSFQSWDLIQYLDKFHSDNKNPGGHGDLKSKLLDCKHSMWTIPAKCSTMWPLGWIWYNMMNVLKSYVIWLI